jgi:hypothetical protein
MPQRRLRLAGQMPARRTAASIPLEQAFPPATGPADLGPLWKLEATLKCLSCRTPRYWPPVHIIRLPEARQTVPYVGVHPTR